MRGEAADQAGGAAQDHVSGVLVSSLDLVEIRDAFERSNLEPGSLARSAEMVDALCAERGLGFRDLGPVPEFSEVEVFRAANGASPADRHLLALLDVGLVLIRELGPDEHGDSRSTVFTELPGASFSRGHSLAGPGWGHMEIQASRLSAPLFRLGWPFDIRSHDHREQMTEVARERDRILAAIRRRRPRSIREPSASTGRAAYTPESGS
jgi:hypothetical protein